MIGSRTMPEYPWYANVEDSGLEQGDILFGLDVPNVPTTEAGETLINVDTYDSIVITQSCDIQKVDQIVLCPVWDVSYAASLHPDLGIPRGLENLRKGRYIAYHLLNKCELEDYGTDYKIVQFDRLLVLPKQTLEQRIESDGSKRLRLLPPYREHLAQAFARYFMRIGLPVDIPPFT